MRRSLLVLSGLLLGAGAGQAHGLLIPVEKTVPPLALLNHQVKVAILDQAAVTQVEQTFRNHTDRQLEATYLFPVPRGASVNKFTMWVNGKEVGGELLEAARARQVYTDIVRRTQDPGLLEYVGTNLLKLRVFPIPPKGDQKIALSFTAVAPQDAGVIEYVYPLKSSGKPVSTLEKFSLELTLKAQHPIQNLYSPTHAVSVQRTGDRAARVTFERDQALLDKDFQLFYTLSDQDVGLSALLHRPLSGEDGYFLLLLSPRQEASAGRPVPRDMVFVLDTSGSMAGVKMDQAKRALKYCLDQLSSHDRFALLNFSSTVNKYRDGLLEPSRERVGHAKQWVENLRASGGTAINDALAAALELRTGDEGRTFTVVFFTDGMPTIGETRPEQILKNVEGKNTANTRIFTFGVGDDVNATLLDQLAEQTRAVSTYVRPAEDIAAKVASLYGKISHPVLANLRLTVSGSLSLSEVYPPHLPDLFHGGQLVVLGRYSGHGPAAVTLTGTVGKETRNHVYELTFPEKTADDKGFVEHLWARRKVGYLLDQIRANGEKKELVDEVVALAKKYGIATPYTSYLVVPDGPVPFASVRKGLPDVRFRGGDLDGKSGGLGGGFAPVTPFGGLPQARGGAGALGASPAPRSVADFAKQVQSAPGKGAANRDMIQDALLDERARRAAADVNDRRDAALQREAQEKKDTLNRTREALARRQLSVVQGGKLGVDLSVQSNQLRNQSRLEQTAQRQVAGRNCLEVGGVWIDEGFDAKMPTVTVKAQSDAYFRLLEKQPQLRAVFQLGNYLVWVAPSGAALVIDTTNGKDKLSDAEIEALFKPRK